jgi:hypothetical protein
VHLVAKAGVGWHTAGNVRTAADLFPCGIFLFAILLLCNTQTGGFSLYLPGSQKMVIIRGFTEFRLASYQDCDALDLDLG